MFIDRASSRAENMSNQVAFASVTSRAASKPITFSMIFDDTAVCLRMRICCIHLTVRPVFVNILYKVKNDCIL